MKTFGTQGPVKSSRKLRRLADRGDSGFRTDRVKKGKYIVLFAPRQTGKTTLFPIRYGYPR